jgi:hypothetical protein
MNLRIRLLPSALFVVAAALLSPVSASAQAIRTADLTADAAPLDTDRDGIADRDESTDTDRDGLVDALDADDDNDGIPTREERPASADRDTDRDGTPDHLDADDDNDGIPTRAERDRDASLDTDRDGLADHLDATDDRANDAPLLITASTGTIAADIDGDARPDVLTASVTSAPPAAPSHFRGDALSLALTAFGLGVVFARRHRA